MVASRCRLRRRPRRGIGTTYNMGIRRQKIIGPRLVAILTIQVAHLTSHIIGTISCADLGRTINLINVKFIA
ncbi:hypothetical protein OUZ56_026729 [Daphnia magna]|uniref:Uncharacterized protein n=1 Tax=Daphnia magna TaxID=35525 RepID=A0ABQ9ZMN6_9CRUS|nr:hypothetical protein OUZ56_026729 [Daphnia magna]